MSEKQDNNQNSQQVNTHTLWTKGSKRSRAGYITAIFLLIASITGIILIIFARDIFGNEIGDQILGEGVANGFVALWSGLIKRKDALIGTLLTITVAIILTFIINFLLTLFGRKNQRRKTISSLLKSLFKYIIIIIALCVVLSLWGVDVTGIIAGVGIFTLIIGLGCQSLVNDFVSGIFIVFDNYFQVGDTVIIDGFRGAVVSVGLRTTKLRDASGNIKSIANSSIQTVVNMSRYESKVLVYIDISFNEDLRRVEAILSDNLEKIAKRIPNMSSGPSYKGVDSLDECGVKLMFLATASEGNRFQVQRDLIRELYLLFQENDVIIPFAQIVVNPADPVDRPKADEKQRQASEKLYSKNTTPVQKTKKKGSFTKEMERALEESKRADDAGV